MTSLYFGQYESRETLLEDAGFLWLETFDTFEQKPAWLQLLHPALPPTYRQALEQAIPRLNGLASGTSLLKYQRLCQNEQHLALIYDTCPVNTGLEQLLPHFEPQYRLASCKALIEALHSAHRESVYLGGLSERLIAPYKQGVALAGLGYGALLEVNPKLLSGIHGATVAPELQNKGKMSAASDLYSVAVLLEGVLEGFGRTAWYARATQVDPQARFQKARDALEELKKDIAPLHVLREPCSAGQGRNIFNKIELTPLFELDSIELASPFATQSTSAKHSVSNNQISMKSLNYIVETSINMVTNSNEALKFLIILEATDKILYLLGGWLEIMDIKNRKVVKRLDVSSRRSMENLGEAIYDRVVHFSDIALSPNNKYIVFVVGRFLNIIDSLTLEVIHLIRVEERIVKIKFAKNSTLMVHIMFSEIWFINNKEKSNISIKVYSKSVVNSININNDGSLISFADYNASRIYVWYIAENEVKSFITMGKITHPHGICFSEDSALILIMTPSCIYIHELIDFTINFQIQLNTNEVRAIFLDLQYLVVKGPVTLFLNFKTGKKILEFNSVTHSDSFEQIIYHPLQKCVFPVYDGDGLCTLDLRHETMSLVYTAQNEEIKSVKMVGQTVLVQSSMSTCFAVDLISRARFDFHRQWPEEHIFISSDATLVSFANRWSVDIYKRQP